MTTNAIAKPRRWNVEVDGICWLPRVSDKARMRESGSLGAYLLGQSPVDRAPLARLGCSTEEFAALRTRGFDEARMRKWSAAFAVRYKTYIALWDLDEGYRTPTAFEKPLMGIARRLIKAP